LPVVHQGGQGTGSYFFFKCYFPQRARRKPPVFSVPSVGK
jgi:hypothetical protein